MLLVLLRPLREMGLDVTSQTERGNMNLYITMITSQTSEKGTNVLGIILNYGGNRENHVREKYLHSTQGKLCIFRKKEIAFFFSNIYSLLWVKFRHLSCCIRDFTNFSWYIH